MHKKNKMKAIVAFAVAMVIVVPGSVVFANFEETTKMNVSSSKVVNNIDLQAFDDAINYSNEEGRTPELIDSSQVSNEISVDDECGCTIDTGFPVMNEILLEPLDSKYASPKPTPIDTPDYFSWKDYDGRDWTTPAKNQLWPFMCGACYDFAALGVLESVINIREGCAELDPDLSEQYVLSCLPIAGSCRGGGSQRVFKYIMSNSSSGNNCNGIIFESCFPYRAVDPDGCDYFNCDHDPVLCSEKCENWEDHLIPISDYGYWLPDGGPEDREAIKTQIMQTGPAVTYMKLNTDIWDWGEEHNDPDDYYPYPGPVDRTDHALILVGWKDDSSIGNGGYWICKNSFSAEWGYEGFFNLEYGSLNIDSYRIDWVDYNPESVNNWTPVAEAGGLYYGDVEQEITFDASNSFDHEGNITRYHWDFGDGNNGSGETTTHTYNTKGIYPVTLTVIDNEDNTGTDTTWAFIDESNDPPNKPTLKGRRIGTTGNAYEYTFSSIDPDGDDVHYYVAWGGFCVEDWIGPFESGEKITVDNTWMWRDIFTVRVKAKDIYGAKSEWATLKVIMPRNREINTPFIQFLENHPRMFPILRHLLGM